MNGRFGAIERHAKTGVGLTDLSERTPEGLSAAFIVITALPIIMIYPFLQRYFVTGLTLGAVKG